MKTIKKAQIESLKNSGHVISIYKNKKIVVVDGWKKYKLA